MILVCSGGHVYDNSTLRGKMSLSGRSENDKCPMCIDYDRMRTPHETKCNRKLYDIDKLVDRLIKNYYGKWYSGWDKIFDSCRIIHDLPRMSNGKRVPPTNYIKFLLLNGIIIKTGYTASQIRDCHNHYIFILGDNKGSLKVEIPEYKEVV